MQKELNKRISDQIVGEILKTNKSLFGKIGYVRLNTLVYNKTNPYKHNSKYQKWYLYIRNKIGPFLLKKNLR